MIRKIIAGAATVTTIIAFGFAIAQLLEDEPGAQPSIEIDDSPVAAGVVGDVVTGPDSPSIDNQTEVREANDVDAKNVNSEAGASAENNSAAANAEGENNEINIGDDNSDNRTYQTFTIHENASRLPSVVSASTTPVTVVTLSPQEAQVSPEVTVSPTSPAPPPAPAPPPTQSALAASSTTYTIPGGWARLPVDNISSFQTTGCVEFFGTEHSTEKYNVTLCGDHPDLSQLSSTKAEKNDRFFYAKLECGTTLTVYEHANYEGPGGAVVAPKC